MAKQTLGPHDIRSELKVASSNVRIIYNYRKKRVSEGTVDVMHRAIRIIRSAHTYVHIKHKGPAGEVDKSGSSVVGQPDPTNISSTLVVGSILAPQGHKFCRNAPS